MSNEDRASYFLRRAQEARERADHATDARVRLVHIEMALRYEQQARREGGASSDSSRLHQIE